MTPEAEQRRLAALDRAINVACAPDIHFSGEVPDFIMSLAEKFETYLKGETE
jgi:hypothetical protein